jgi:hypothetical protein
MIPLYWLRAQKILSADAGMHRWVWDLRYPPPNSTLHEYPIAAVPHDTPRYPLGPLVLPGKYTVRLTAAGRTQSSSLTIRMDPRVRTTAAGLKQKFDLEIQLADAIGRSSEAVSQARSVQEQLTNLNEKRGAAFADSTKALAASVKAILDGDDNSDHPTLKAVNNDTISLYKEVEKSDAAPTLAQVNAANHLLAELEVTRKQWEQLKTNLSALNLQLPAAGLPAIRFDTPPREDETGENEE